MRTFLLNTITHWNEPPRARHQIAYALSRNHHVIFVAANTTGHPRITTEKISESFTVVTPRFPIDVRIRYRLPVLNEIYQTWLFKRLKRHYGDAVVINFDYTANRLYKHFDKYVYYCNDSFTAISRHLNPGFIYRYHVRCESRVAEKAVFCVSVIKHLQDNLKKYNPNSFEILLGSPDIKQYQIDINYHPEVRKKINIGLVGFIKFYNTSHILVNKLLEDPNFTLTMIGPVEQKFLDHLKNKENLILTGPLTGKELFTRLNNLDVAIAPYHSNLLEDVYVGTGNKFYQYYVVGKPIVFAPVSGMKKMTLPPGFVYIAEDEDDFQKQIYRAVKENTTALIKQRIQFAKDNSWEKRAKQLISYCDEFKL